MLMTTKEILKLLEKHEESCDKRYGEINDKLKRLEDKLWGLAILIFISPFAVKLFETMI
jgi:hypothetical protein|tara:strand:- start:157 stop:333 length:177 start_codon:yes stop_codon:yes gene_type:complete